MNVLVRTGHHLKGTAELARHVGATIESSLARFGSAITRVTVHFSDERGGRPHGGDRKCVIEVRPAGRPPIASTHHGDTSEQSLSGAINDMVRLLDRAFHRRNHPRGRGARQPQVA